MSARQALTSGRRRGRRGQTLVEFALVITVFMLAVMGIFDFGRGILYYNMLSNAAREGARFGVIATRTDGAVCARAGSATQLPGVTYPVTTCDTPFGALEVSATREPEGSYQVRLVTLEYDFALITPLIGNIVGNPIRLTASSRMYIEN